MHEGEIGDRRRIASSAIETTDMREHPMWTPARRMLMGDI
jgi:hypothetical protein